MEMSMKCLLIMLCCCLFSHEAIASGPVALTSPDKKIRYEFEIRDGHPGYRVFYEKKMIIDFSAAEVVIGGVSPQNMQIAKMVLKDSAEHYKLYTGRNSTVNDSFRQLTVYLTNNKNQSPAYIIDVRAFNDGVAFRYRFVKQGTDSVFITEENTAFQIAGNPATHALLLPDYYSSHEGFYRHGNYQSLPTDSLMDMPLLLSYPDSLYLVITEAALLNYGGMYFRKKPAGLVSDISPNISHKGNVAVLAAPNSSPWRVIMISHDAGRFLETNILTDLAPPRRMDDISWLKPGKTTFPWWNGNVTPDTLNAPGNNFVTQQYYIDFCARNHIEYHSVVEYGLHQWYQDDGVSFMPGPNSNVLKAVPGLDMKEVCDYAHRRGVGVRVWTHWKALYPKLDSAFALFQQWGLSGLMVDFMDRDDQDMVNIQTEILEKAAVHHLHIQFHGAYKPTGLSRTYPNEFTREGALNYEHDKWNPKGVSPEHDLDIAFTRAVAGSTDYHLGGFRAVIPEQFRAQYTRPLVLGTRCHMLAMYVVLENANAMVCDYPEAYENKPGFDFLKQVPTTWDETKVLQAVPDHFLLIARRKGSAWWIGGINNQNSRSLDLVFPFLEKGAWEATVYEDDPKQPFDPNHVVLRSVPLQSSEKLKIFLASGGGVAIKMERK